MDSDSSSASSGLSFQSSPSREPTPEYDPTAAYEALAPPHWDEADWDFSVWSEDDESLTDGEDDLQFLVNGELEEESDDDAFYWGEDISSDEEDEAEEDTSSDEYPPATLPPGRRTTTTKTKKPLPVASTAATRTSPAAVPMAAMTATMRAVTAVTAATASAPRLGTTRIGLQQDGPEPTHEDGSPFKFLPPAPVVLFCKSSPPLKKVMMQSQPISPKSASKSKVSSGPAAPRAPIKARTAVRKVAARKTLKRRNPSPDQESLHASTEDNSSEETQSSRGDSSSGNSGKITTQSQPDLPPSASRKRPVPEPVAPQAPIRAGQGGQRTKSRCIKRARKEPQAPSSNQEASNTDDTSSGGVEEVLMPSANLDPAIPIGAVDKVANLAKPPAETQEPITSSSAVPLVSGEGCDLSGLLTFDPESIEPAPSTACDEPRPSAVLRQFQRLKALLSSPIETLVEDPEEVKSVLEEIQHHLPVKGEVSSSENRSTPRQLPLKTDIADKCQRLNEKKAALDTKTDTSVNTAELETLRKELEDLEERVRATKQLISDKEALIARSQEEAEGLKAQLKTDLAEIRDLHKQLVTGKDEDDEAEIAEVDRVRADALRAFEAFLL
ncbi:hypothetical protein QYE76_008481 [Lolium multiflorum]|uniref:Uncharacterized protein n=1 Tax=Lolium multiflorum TaxID=4521 RepID=A0AAD8TT10_LOLMU|nr:hypothetical protein QYE76_008481 [Lolium multiflorum]